MIGSEIDHAIHDLESKGFKFVSSTLSQGSPLIITNSGEKFKQIFYSYPSVDKPSYLKRVFNEVQKFDWSEVKAIHATYECFLVKEVPRYQ